MKTITITALTTTATTTTIVVIIIIITNGSPNPGKNTKPYNNQQEKKENLPNCRHCCPSWPQNKTERMWKEG